MAPNASEYLPDSQEMHVLELLATTLPEYLPIWQAVHVCASASE